MIERGSVVLVAGKGDYGKPRPAVVIQNSRMLEWIESITVCFLTSDLSQENLLRILVEPNNANGLRSQSQIQVEKIMTFPVGKVRGPIGHIGEEVLKEVERGLIFHLDLVAPVSLTTTG